MKWSKKSDRELCQFFCLLLPSALHPLILSRIDSLCHQLIQKLGQSVEQNVSNWKLWIFKNPYFYWESIYKRVNAASRVFWTNDWSTVRCVSSNNVGKRVLITSFLSILQSRQSKEKFFMVGEIGTQSINAPKSFYTFFSKVSSPNQSYFYNRNSAIERQRNSNQKNVQGKKKAKENWCLVLAKSNLFPIQVLFFFAPISPFMDHQLIQFSSMTQFDEKWKLKVEVVIKPFLTITERWLAKGIILNFD